MRTDSISEPEIIFFLSETEGKSERPEAEFEHDSGSGTTSDLIRTQPSNSPSTAVSADLGEGEISPFSSA